MSAELRLIGRYECNRCDQVLTRKKLINGMRSHSQSTVVRNHVNDDDHGKKTSFILVSCSTNQGSWRRNGQQTDARRFAINSNQQYLNLLVPGPNVHTSYCIIAHTIVLNRIGNIVGECRQNTAHAVDRRENVELRRD